MRIGFPFGVEGLGGTRSWVKVFSEYCVSKGHEVFFTHNDKVDAFITIANASRYEDLKKVKENGAKIIHRMDGIFFEYHLFENESTEKVNNMLTKNTELADLIVCQSEFTNNLMDYLLGKDNKIPRRIIYNGVNEKLFSKVGEVIPRDTNKKLVLSIAYWGVPRMAEFSMKAIVNVARLLPEYEFWILGFAYPITREYMNNIDIPSNITRIELTNPIPRDEMPKYIRTADLVLHSRPHDACSNLILESMTIGKPVVGLSTGSTPELLGDSGLVGNCYGGFEKLPISIDYDHLANQVKRTFDNYEYYKQKITERSKMFTQTIMSEAYLNCIEELMV